MKRNEILKYEQGISIEMESKEARKHRTKEANGSKQKQRGNEVKRS